jgi:hypothetical protein
MYHKPKLHDVTYIQGKTLQKEQRKEPAIKHSSRLTCETKKTVGHVHVGNEGDRGVNVGAPKKRSKFVPVTGSKDMSCVSVRLPGRHLCDCQAQQHALVNNCISCGRVVCEQEGAGPCAFCGSLVCSPADWEMVKSNSSRGKKLLEKLMNQKGQEHSAIRTSPDSQKDISISNKESLEKALEHRDKLLDFDRTSEKRTRVIDDEMDYFASDTNQWLSREERKALKSKEEDLHEMRHGSRRNRKVTLDFAGRRVKDEVEEATYSMYDDKQAFKSQLPAHSTRNVQSNAGELANPAIDMPQPTFQLSKVDKERKTVQKKKKQQVDGTGRVILRIQDKGLQEMRDEGQNI